MSHARPPTSRRVVLFEVATAAYALPIENVLEVAELGAVWGVPTLTPGVAGVMNHHGSALPVLRRRALFGDSPACLGEPTHILVLGREGELAGRLGIPVDRVLGLADQSRLAARASRPAPGRRPGGGAPVVVLDPGQLLERAAQLINSERAAADRSQGGRE